MSSLVFYGLACSIILILFKLSISKDADADAKSDVVQKLVPNALWYFRWAAAFTFDRPIFTLLLKCCSKCGHFVRIFNGNFHGCQRMVHNRPNQKKVIAGAEDSAVAAAKAGLASRTNTLFSIPMLYLMIHSAHSSTKNLPFLMDNPLTGLWIGMAIILIIEIERVFENE